jgi:hypothetical protein
MKHYEQERNIEVHRTDDCKYRYGDSNGAGGYQLHGAVSSSQILTVTNWRDKTKKVLSLFLCFVDGFSKKTCTFVAAILQ